MSSDKNVTKAELISGAADEAGVAKATAEKVLNAIINNVQSALVGGKAVTLVGFGTFKVSHRKARKGRNPRTKKEINIPASKVPKFSPGKNLREAVNN